MTTPNELSPVGGEEPLKPTHSLPRYSEPTPETHRRVSREEEAELALKNTRYSAGARPVLIILFLVTILAVPVIQFASEIAAPAGSGPPGTFNLYKAYPAWKKITAVRSGADLWHLLPRAAELKAAEKELETDSTVSEWLLPRVQWLLSEKLGVGNEQVYLGQGGWLFYRPDIDYITGPPFLDSMVATRRAHAAAVQSDPVKAITHFRDQLRSRGIDLVLLPIPMKPGVEGEHLAARVSKPGVFHNSSFGEFRKRLEQNHVRVFDPTPLLAERKSANRAQSLYLENDTHWRPETMEFVAEKLALFIQPAATADTAGPAESITGTGDIARMLRLPASQNVFHPETVTVHPVTPDRTPWRPAKNADTLLLGDSFCNIYSLRGLGWGEAAGFAEHLSQSLGRPLDCILRNSDAAFATREILSRELGRGRDRLAGKKLVIWEFATRELAFGDWKLLDLKLQAPKAATFFVPKAGETVKVTATVQAISNVPRPGSVPYTDHILALHLIDVAPAGGGEPANVEAIVYVESMHDNVLTDAARLAPGDHVTLQLRAWSDVAEKYEKINRSEIDDPAVQLEEPCWGELTD
ncbi:MAG: alginate O-acetyltransferase AlgX-related protein [Chthoniobacterales bacterium]